MIPWDKLHGAMTHFPIALLLFSTACDFVSVMLKKLPFARGLRLVSFYGLAVAALAGSVATLELRRSLAIAPAKLDCQCAEQTKNETME